MGDIWDSLKQGEVSRRHFLQLSAAAAASAALSIDSAAVEAADAALRAAMTPLADFIRKSYEVEQAINKALPPKIPHLFSASPPVDAAPNAIAATQTLTSDAATLTAQHPATQQILDGYFAVYPEYRTDILTAAADFMLDNRTLGFSPPELEAASTVKNLGHKLGDEQRLKCQSIIAEAIAPHKRTEPYKAFIKQVITLSNKRSRLRKEYLVKLGVSDEVPVLSPPPPPAGGGVYFATTPESDAARIEDMLSGMRHLPIEDLAALGNATELLETLQSAIPELRITITPAAATPTTPTLSAPPPVKSLPVSSAMTSSTALPSATNSANTQAARLLLQAALRIVEQLPDAETPPTIETTPGEVAKIEHQPTIDAAPVSSHTKRLAEREQPASTTVQRT